MPIPTLEAPFRTLQSVRICNVPARRGGLQADNRRHRELVDAWPGGGAGVAGKLQRYRLAPALIAVEVAGAAVPVGQHPALAFAAIHGVRVPRGSMRVTVDETRVIVFP